MRRPHEEAAVLDPRRRRHGDADREGVPSSEASLRAASLAPVLFVGIVAAVVRFSLLDHQSLWFDEIVSATLAKQPFGSMLHDIASTESTPPLYYVFLWVWVRVFGHTAIALRSLSACFGVLTVLVLYATARLRFSRRAALVTGALAATHPMLVWYSQEARAYSLLTLLVSLSLYFFVRALSSDSTWIFAGWAVSGALAITTHYFAAFVVLTEAALLLYFLRSRLRAPLLATLLPIATAAAFLPLAIHQRNSGHTDFLSTIPLTSRVRDAGNDLLVGRYIVSASHLVVLYVLIAAAVAISIWRRADREEMRAATILLVIAVAALGLSLVVTPGAFFHRNLIVVLPPLLLLAGLACGLRKGGTLALAVGCIAAAGLLVPSALIAERRSLQREDWRNMAALVGAPNAARAILTYPRFEYMALLHYRPHLRVVDSGTLRVRELVVVGRARLDTLRLPTDFRPVEDKRLGTLRILTLRAQRQSKLDVEALHLRPVLRLLHQNRYMQKAPGQDATLLVDR